MMRFIIAFLLTASTVFIFGKAIEAKIPQANALTVVELFTSQSCSSCPPADQVLNDISPDPDIITLGFHVTYWDHLHWKDTLSRKFATERQRAYARYKQNGRVYTPQMIVNGGAEFTGSNRRKLNNAMKRSTSLHPLDIHMQGESITFDLPTLEQNTYTLWVFGTKDTLTQPIKSGENRGRTVTYTNSVLTHFHGGSWDGTAGTRTLQVPIHDDIDRLTVLVQNNGYGAIVAAGQSKLK